MGGVQDERAVKDFANQRRDRCAQYRQMHLVLARCAWLADLEEGDADVGQSLRSVGEQDFRLAVINALNLAIRRKTHGVAIGADFDSNGFSDLAEKANTIPYAATVIIMAMVAAILHELIQ